MDARLVSVVLLLAAVLSLGANYRTRNFLVSAATPQLARQVGDEAERFRRELALDWLGRELPPWQSACPIRVQVAPNMGAGGATSFTFSNGYPSDWQMEVFGSEERVLDSVLPHEVMHTVFATHFRQPLPRWADEGACTTVEHASEREKHAKLLIRFLTTGKGIAFNRMFAMKQYPPEMLPLYAQGYSVARYLVEQGGKRKYVEFVGEGLRTNNWNAAIRKHYAYKDLSELQLRWVAWVGDGSPPLDADVFVSSVDEVKDYSAMSPDDGSTPARPGALVDVPPRSAGQTVLPGMGPAPGQPQELAPVTPIGSPAGSTGRSWYAEQRDRARQSQASRTAARPQPGLAE